jgi:hypothetical protein
MQLVDLLTEIRQRAWGPAARMRTYFCANPNGCRNIQVGVVKKIGHRGFAPDVQSFGNAVRWSTRGLAPESDSIASNKGHGSSPSYFFGFRMSGFISTVILLILS